MKIFKLTLIIFFTIIGCWVIFTHATAQMKPTAITRTENVMFKGTLLIASDADQIGTAYANHLINKVEGIEDSLTILRFDTNENPIIHAIHVSNSVISWPAIITHSPDKKLAYVVETRSIYQKKTQQLQNIYKDMPNGTKLTILDINNNQNPVILQQISISTNPKTASVNAKGDLLVTTSIEKGKEITLATLQNGLVNKIFTFGIDGLERAGSNGGVNFVEFHPELDILAVIKDNQSVAFYKVNRNIDVVNIEPMGELRNLGKVLSVGNFTPDGKFFLVSDVGWGDSPLGNVLNGKGRLISIQFDNNGNHKLVSKVKVGLSPEGFDISPDGNWAVAVNMRRTYLPKGLPYNLFAARNRSSLSLVKINAQTGELKTIGKEYGFEGELPEDAAFDLDSKTIAVTIYNERYEAFPKQGYIEFWQLANEKLLRTSTKIPVTRGPHCIKVVK